MVLKCSKIVIFYENGLKATNIRLQSAKVIKDTCCNQ